MVCVLATILKRDHGRHALSTVRKTSGETQQLTAIGASRGTLPAGLKPYLAALREVGTTSSQVTGRENRDRAWSTLVRGSWSSQGPSCWPSDLCGPSRQASSPPLVFHSTLYLAYAMHRQPLSALSAQCFDLTVNGTLSQCPQADGPGSVLSSSSHLSPTLPHSSKKDETAYKKPENYLG